MKMAAVTLEERVKAVEEEISLLKAQMPATDQEPTPWWKKIVGVYKDDPEFEEAERLGREWRESFRPKKDEVAPL